jgi:hypothetical protein
MEATVDNNGPHSEYINDGRHFGGKKVDKNLRTKVRVVLLLSQPGRHSPRIKPHAGTDPETWNATSLRQLEDRNSRHR